jgi:hypothetical protein
MIYRRKVFYLIIISTLMRLLIAGITEFGNDEVYYYTYALHLQWNYFDHPPGVALLIRLTTLNLWLTNELFVRLGAVLCAAAGTWLSYKPEILSGMKEQVGMPPFYTMQAFIQVSLPVHLFCLIVHRLYAGWRVCGADKNGASAYA